jgi:hypothetical protein
MVGVNTGRCASYRLRHRQPWSAIRPFCPTWSGVSKVRSQCELDKKGRARKTGAKEVNEEAKKEKERRRRSKRANEGGRRRRRGRRSS